MGVHLRKALNEDKTRLRDARCDAFDFLGYACGPMYSPRTGARYRRARGASVVAGLNDVDEYDEASGETTGGRRPGGLCQQCRVTVL